MNLLFLTLASILLLSLPNNNPKAMIPPSFLKGVEFTNKSHITLTITTKHKSLEITTVTLMPEQTEKIERSIDHGSYTTIDPIEKITVSAGGDYELFEHDVVPNGIEERRYDVLLKDRAVFLELVAS